MSTTIDNKVVEMSFDNKDFESGVKQSLGTLDKLKKALTFDNVGKGFENLSSNFTPLNNGLIAAQNGFTALETIAFGALTRIGAKIADIGMNMVKSLTIDPIKDGFSEYELKMGSVQTIMAGTGAPLEQVMDKLNELNKYADRTIYSFADMTSNIGKFTNAGVDLDTAVAAIQGVANVAAVSGANAAEASRAMYNFSQALSSGYVKLIDWKSIENANMATVEFKTQLLESAVAAGTLTKTADGMYKTVNGGFAVSATKNFNDSLQKQWMTTEVLTETLKKYTDETTEIGKKAFAAAQDVKTFTQLMDTLKEAVGSGWAETWEIVFGNFEEAKKLWTSVSNVVGGFIDRQSDLRNSVLGSWKEFGGRDSLLAALSNLGKLLKEIISPIKKAFNVVNPFFGMFTGPDTDKMAAKLRVLTSNFKYFTERLKITTKESDGLFHLFRGIFSIFGTAGKLIGSVVKGFKGIFNEFDGLGDGIGKAATKIGDFLFNLSLSAKRMNIFKQVTDTTAEVVHRLAGVIKSVIELIGNLFNRVTSTIKLLKTFSYTSERVNIIVSGIIYTVKDLIVAITKAVGSILGIDVSGFIDKINNFFVSVVEHAGKFIYTVAKIPSTLSSVFTKLTGLKPSEVFDKIKESASNAIDTIKQFFSGFKGIDTSSVDKFAEDTERKFQPLTSIFNGLGKAFGVLWEVLKKIAPIFLALGSIIGDALGSLSDKISEKLSSLEINVDSIANLLSSGGILALGVGFNKLVGKDGIFGGAGNVLESISGILNGVKESLETWQNSIKANTIMKIAGAIAVVTVSLIALAAVDSTRLAAALTILGAGMAELFTMFKGTTALSLGDNVKGTATAMLLMSASVLVLSMAMVKLAKIDADKLFAGVLAITALLGALTGVVKVLGSNEKKMVSGGAAMILFAVAINLLVKPIEKLGNLPLENLGKGLLAVATMMGTIAIFVKVLNSSKFGVGTAISIILLAAAINLLIKPIQTLGSMDIKQLVQGMIAFGVALGLIDVFANTLGKNANRMITASVGMVLIGAAMHIIAGAIAKLGEISFDKMLKGLAGMGLALLELIVTLNLLPADVLLKSIGLTIAATSLVILANAMQSLSDLSWEEIAKALVAIGVALLELSIALIAMQGTIAGSAALLVAALALGVLTPVIKALGGMSWEEIGKSLLMLAGTFVILAAGAFLLTPLVVPLLGVAAAVALLGIGVATLGAGVLALSAGLAMLAITGTAGVAVLTLALEAIIGLIPSLAKAVGRGIVEIIKVIGESIPTILDAITNIVSAILDVLITLIPKIVEFIKTLFVALREIVPDLIDTLLDILVGVLQGINEHIDEIIYELVMIVAHTIEGLINAIPDFIVTIADALGKAIPELFTKLGDSLVENAPLLRDSIIYLGKSIVTAFKEFFGINSPSKTFSELGTYLIEGLINGIKDMISKVIDAVRNLFTKVKDWIREQFEIFKTLGKNAIEHFKTGIENMKESVKTAISNVVNAIKEKITGFFQDFKDIGKNLVQGFIDGITGKKKDAEAAAASLGNGATAGASAALGVKSPSRVFRRIGRYVDEGFILGMKDYASKVEDASSSMGNSAVNAMQTTLDRLSDSMNEEIDANPTITPILDLSEIQNGSNMINGLLGNQRMSLAFASDGFNSNRSFDINAENNDFMRATMTEVFAKFVPEIVNAINTSAANQKFTFDLTPNTRRFYKEMRVENRRFENSNGYNGLV